MLKRCENAEISESNPSDGFESVTEFSSICHGETFKFLYGSISKSSSIHFVDANRDQSAAAKAIFWVPT